ncbi:MAG TPA: hypothetical protein EYG21_07580 [Nitrospinaceae bacterium]|nr:hypothetical protein [Nitrospinaceae bacterium]
MIECQLQPIKQRACDTPSKRTKYGIYSQQMFWNIKTYAKKCWAVVVNIELDYEEAKKTYDSDDEIIKECIEFLNEPPKSKYGKRRKRKPLYGAFNSEPLRYSIKEEDGKFTICAFLLTNADKNKMFWGRGPNV